MKLSLEHDERHSQVKWEAIAAATLTSGVMLVVVTLLFSVTPSMLGRDIQSWQCIEWENKTADYIQRCGEKNDKWYAVQFVGREYLVKNETCIVTYQADTSGSGLTTSAKCCSDDDYFGSFVTERGKCVREALTREAR